MNNIPATSSKSEGARRALSRRGLLIYFVVLIAVSAFLEWKLIEAGEFIGKHPGLVLSLMYTPALSSFVARLALREGFSDISFGLGGRAGARAMFIAWIYALTVGFIAYGIAWSTGLAQFQPPAAARSHFFGVLPTGSFFATVVVTSTLGTLFSCLSAAGEEIGWRGYMLTRVIDAGMPKPVFVSGLIWALWHIPLILSGQYAAGAHPHLSAILFAVDIIAAAYLAAYLRLRSGSVWPAVLFHGAWNAIIQGAFDRSTVDKPLAVGESGYLTALVSVLVVAWLARGTWTLLRRPGEILTLSGDKRGSFLTL